MKKICLVILFAIFASFCLFAETYLEVVESKDEWGDKTDDSYLIMGSDDFTYSNSYTFNEEGYVFFIYFFPQYDNICGAAVISRWSNSVDRFIIDDSILVKYRDANKKVTEVKTKRAYNENATFALMDSSANKLIETMKNTNKIQLIITGTNYEKDTQYKVTFEYDPKEFVSYLEEIGWGL